MSHEVLYSVFILWEKREKLPQISCFCV